MKQISECSLLNDVVVMKEAVTDAIKYILNQEGKLLCEFKEKGSDIFNENDNTIKGLIKQFKVARTIKSSQIFLLKEILIKEWIKCNYCPKANNVSEVIKFIRDRKKKNQKETGELKKVCKSLISKIAFMLNPEEINPLDSYAFKFVECYSMCYKEKIFSDMFDYETYAIYVEEIINQLRPLIIIEGSNNCDIQKFNSKCNSINLNAETILVRRSADKYMMYKAGLKPKS